MSNQLTIINPWAREIQQQPLKNDATVKRLKKLTSQKGVTLKLINEKLTTPTESIYYLQGHSKFRQYADYIVFVSAKEE